MKLSKKKRRGGGMGRVNQCPKTTTKTEALVKLPRIGTIKITDFREYPLLSKTCIFPLSQSARKNNPANEAILRGERGAGSIVRNNTI